MTMKELIFVGSSKEDLLEFPDEVQDETGYALYLEQMGDKPPKSKILKGFGNANVREIVDNDSSGTYRTVYTVEKPEFVFVLHAFQKKSKSGIATPQQEINKVKARLKEVDVLYNELKEEGHGKKDKVRKKLR
ncbi:MAG: type II toxin-antitoxin system RelE/ParE family toxin [Verrucomicrobia bacterium]|nr:type II toxin-antitoxin system RelE/ParE family toxin [Verrucomicrobiota bacterium]